MKTIPPFKETTQRIKDDFFRRAHEGLFETPYPGYPSERFSSPEVPEVLPEGPWNYSKKDLPPLDEAELHPWLEDMVKDEKVGVITGTGAYYYRGPNYTADVIAISRFFKRILLIQRGDTGSWGVPGGFVDPGESYIEAGSRELAEETRLGRFIRVFSKPVLLYSGVLADKRATTECWPEGHAILVRPLFPWPHVRGGDDTVKARWFKLDKRPEMFGSHGILTELGIQAVSTVDDTQATLNSSNYEYVR